jgi:V8-like Glu-specific endopeptidase
MMTSRRVLAIAAVAVLICAAVVALAVARPGTDRTAAPGRGPGAVARYWTQRRLTHATPQHGPGFRNTPVPAQSPQAHRALLGLRVGALFERQGNAEHFCTASVVDSPGRDLLVTAAHCINSGKGGSYRQDIVFIPDYRDGRAPYGIWTIRRLLVAPQWADASDPDFDVGFVVLNSLDGKNIEDILGANRLGLDASYQYLVRVTGYPDSDAAPVTCLNYTTEESTTQLRFECAGETGGTSGSPWMTHFDSRTRTGTIVGVLGGYQQGGDTPDISYSALLGSAIQRLYQQAISDESSPGGS